MDDTAQLVRRLLGALDGHAITWCHWKSNDMLAASASGENDLDLLVARADVGRCRALLHEHGFVEAVQRPSRRLPGVLDYHGNDPDVGRPIHVHLHARLVLGDDMTKNYHLPLEGAYLASIHREGLFWVPSADLELIVFVIRMVLKHCSVDSMVMFSGQLSAAEHREFGKLEGNAQEHEVQRHLARLLPELDAALFDACREVLAGTVGTTGRLARGVRLERALAPYARRPIVRDVPLKSVRRLGWAGRRVVLPRTRRKSLPHGGLVVSIRGGTPDQRARLVSLLDGWLARDLAVLPVGFRASPRRAARRAGRFSASGGLVLTADHPAVRGRPRMPGVPPPDLEFILTDAQPGHAEDARPGVVHLALDTPESVRLAAARRSIWEHL